LEFQKPDFKKFKALELAYHAMEKGGNLPCIMNAANEVAVQAFLDRKIAFLDMANIVEEAMNRSEFVKQSRIEDYVEMDQRTRLETDLIIKNII
jgi:1-deoxy-D-xylulose-5-phosphate reductoisomerase